MQIKNASILIIDDDADVLIAIKLLLKAKVKEVTTEKNPNHIQALITQKKFDVVILDMNFNGLVNTGNEGIFWLKKIKEINADIQVILITAYGDIDLAIKGLKEGASDFLIKPWQNEKLLSAIEETAAKKTGGPEKLWKPVVYKGSLLGESKAMKDIFLKIKKVAPTDANVLILGENGTGKDLIAKAIHDNSLRKDKPFIKVDVGALTPSLFESELFGHKKGAFTDAREDRKGRFEIANGGTLFLDEIGNITLQQQARLLTVLQNRHITPIGANQSVALDIRLICATNVGLETLADESKFRKDLIYRINTVEINVAPLRERENDILILAKHYLEQYAEKYFKPEFKLDDTAIKKLMAHYFPGNVRELQYVLERAVIMAESNRLYADDLVFSPLEKHFISEKTEDVNLDSVEKSTIEKVIEKNNGNISKSAKELGITRNALYRRLNKYGL
ncbi:sigma-54-dependent transcriptional regulator [Zhouia sp. PK063]|uniref:sigma-54-dependent transcriptional regulator n=1 Tax=Zhouia sp. PK063 TaxID=3373602 RepID=UPI0037BB4659